MQFHCPNFEYSRVMITEDYIKSRLFFKCKMRRKRLKTLHTKNITFKQCFKNKFVRLKRMKA